jgi:hypothetical protein
LPVVIECMGVEVRKDEVEKKILGCAMIGAVTANCKACTVRPRTLHRGPLLIRTFVYVRRFHGG